MTIFPTSPNFRAICAQKRAAFLGEHASDGEQEMLRIAKQKLGDNA